MSSINSEAWIIDFVMFGWQVGNNCKQGLSKKVSFFSCFVENKNILALQLGPRVSRVKADIKVFDNKKYKNFSLIWGSELFSHGHIKPNIKPESLKIRYCYNQIPWQPIKGRMLLLVHINCAGGIFRNNGSNFSSSFV